MIIKVPSQTIPCFYDQEEACEESDEHLQSETLHRLFHALGI